MLIGAQPLASGPLAVALGSTYEPVYVVRGQAFNWRVRLLVDGMDLTGQVTGTLDVDREEGAAAVAGFVLYQPPGPVVPDDWKGKPVQLDFISRDRDGVITEARLFTGRLEMPEWDPTWRLLACDCSDQLQQRIEGMSIAAIDALTGGVWSADLFEPTTGRSRWDYAQERMESRAASLDCSVDGVPRVTPWGAATTPHFVFGLGSTLFETVQIDLQPLGAATNRLEVDASYRYPRLWQHVQLFTWSHPEYGSSGIPGFCQWRTWTSELPTTDMIEGAVTGAGLTMVGRVGGFKLPLSLGNPCGDGVAWINQFDNLWLSAIASGGRRWTQQVTENYKLVLTAPGGESEATRVIARDSGNVAIENSAADEWESGKPDGTGSTDLAEEPRRVAALQTLLRSGAVELLSAHRGTTLSWQVPTDLALGVDLVHTLRLEDRALAQGKCRRIQHRIDIEAGTAVTTLSVAISRGGGVSDALTTPARPDTSLAPLPIGGGGVPTQLGGRLNDPISGAPIEPYNDNRLGFSGNWDVADDLTAPKFPRRFDVEASEIPEIYRDERTGAVTVHYRVGIPNDLLEL
ncbi:hypothetical protein [Ectopseudomonas alcaliphila]|uniref:Uncharacterized protein n=1 Tax=Ectopseudomonas alcaliphila TaxID=101564 RepID=A0A1G7MJ50_9GAMM|nr:hypothetical protein [Pseudomonas alcaliphila]MDX5994950.1 hypothetical protein [Pseudomonas alcaliphila]SDF61805.1 hypothetical protein SAMN05216575_10969 [Pseudomonas alcaliphila]